MKLQEFIQNLQVIEIPKNRLLNTCSDVESKLMKLSLGTKL